MFVLQCCGVLEKPHLYYGLVDFRGEVHKSQFMEGESSPGTQPGLSPALTLFSSQSEAFWQHLLP